MNSSNMADPAAKSYWKRVNLTFVDGMKMTCVIDTPTFTDLQDPKKRVDVMNTLRKNREEIDSAVQRQMVTSCQSTSQQEPQPKPPTAGNKKGDSEIAEVEEEKSDNSDVDMHTSSYTQWPRGAVELLISLYKDHEAELEDPRIKKKDIWAIITTKIQEEGYRFNQNKVESKWRSLLMSHKEVKLNKQKTGSKRKNFQYYSEIEEIVSKRHDINPPILAGSGIERKKMRTDCNVDEHSEESGSSLSKSVSACRRRHERRETNNEVLQFLREMEAKRQQEHTEREENRNRRAEARNNIVTEILDILKKD